MQNPKGVLLSMKQRGELQNVEFDTFRSGGTDNFPCFTSKCRVVVAEGMGISEESQSRTKSTAERNVSEKMLVALGVTGKVWLENLHAFLAKNREFTMQMRSLTEIPPFEVRINIYRDGNLWFTSAGSSEKTKKNAEHTAAKNAIAQIHERLKTDIPPIIPRCPGSPPSIVVLIDAENMSFDPNIHAPRYENTTYHIFHTSLHHGSVKDIKYPWIEDVCIPVSKEEAVADITDMKIITFATILAMTQKDIKIIIVSADHFARAWQLAVRGKFPRITIGLCTPNNYLQYLEGYKK